MLGLKPRNHNPSTEGKWKITKKDLEAVLNFAEEIQRLIGRMADRKIPAHTHSRNQATPMTNERASLRMWPVPSEDE
jgi:hypothetical protein